MVKRRIAKKKAVKRKINTNRNKKTSPDITTMSKLEYEQALMDPRFRAVMSGFTNVNNPLANNMLREQETKNNQLTRELNLQNDLINQQKRNHALKSQLAQAKIDHQQELLKKTVESDNKLKTAQIEELKQKFEYDKQIQDLNSQIAESKRIINDQQERFKQNQELANATREKDMLTFKNTIQEELHPILEETANLKAQIDINDKKHDTSMQMIKALDENISSRLQNAVSEITTPLEEKTTILQNQIKSRQQESEIVSQISNLVHELQSANMTYVNQQITQPLQQQLNDLKNKIAINNDIFEQMDKQDELKRQLEQAQMKADPDKRAEFLAKVSEASKETHQLEMLKSFADEVSDAHRNNEAIKSNIVTLCAKIFEDFDISWFSDLSVFKSKLIERHQKINADLAELHQEKEELDRAYNSKKQLEEAKYKKLEAEAKLGALSTEQYQKDMISYHTAKANLQSSIENIDHLNQHLEDTKSKLRDIVNNVTYNWRDFLNSNPTFKATAQAIAQKRGSDTSNIEDIPTFHNLIDDVSKLTNEAEDKDLKIRDYQNRLKQTYSIIHGIQQLDIQNNIGLFGRVAGSLGYRDNQHLYGDLYEGIEVEDNTNIE